MGMKTSSAGLIAAGEVFLGVDMFLYFQNKQDNDGDSDSYDDEGKRLVGV